MAKWWLKVNSLKIVKICQFGLVFNVFHDDVIKWKHFPRYWPFFSLWGESTGDRWFPLTKANDAELWCFLWSAPEQTVKQAIETRVIWDAIALSMTSPYCEACNLFHTCVGRHTRGKKTVITYIYKTPGINLFLLWQAWFIILSKYFCLLLAITSAYGRQSDVTLSVPLARGINRSRLILLVRG